MTIAMKPADDLSMPVNMRWTQGEEMQAPVSEACICEELWLKGSRFETT